MGPTFASDLQVCQVLQVGEWQRVPHAPKGFWHPLRRAGIRERESLGWAGGWTGEEIQTNPGPGEGSWAGMRGRVLLLKPSTGHTSKTPYLHQEGVGPAAPKSLWSHPCPAGLCPLALVFVHIGRQVQHHPHHHQLRGSLHLRGSGEFSPHQALTGGQSG